MVATRWAPTSSKWNYNPYKWPKITGQLGDFTLLIEVITPLTPLKINMESQNHPIEKENHLNQTFMTWGSI